MNDLFKAMSDMTKPENVQQQIDNDELIGNFYISQGGYDHRREDWSFYGSDWNMIMPVVEKIVQRDSSFHMQIGMNSGSYTFEPFNSHAEEQEHLKQFDQVPEVKFMGLGDVLSEEKTEDEKPQVSLYNLLHHSTDDLHILGLAMISYQFKHFDTREQNPDLYAKITSWVNLVESAIKERQLIESEAWADKTAKEINEATK